MHKGVLLVFLLLVGPLYASAETIGDWNTVLAKQFSESFTSNSSGSSLGILCANKNGKCFLYLDPKLQCTEKAVQPILLNSASGAYATTSSCIHLANRQILVLAHFDMLVKMIEENNSIGIALPLAGGQFKAARFSLRGSTKSIEWAKSMAIARKSLNKGTSKKDVYF